MVFREAIVTVLACGVIPIELQFPPMSLATAAKAADIDNGNV